ncbi:MAG: acetyl-CoA acetyltransferase [Candidatus Puniceispirillales bacterium]|jgi:acetyl-CoA acetyltransferase|tara:strand:+ start:1593 stop:2783 length:1191 start_codon:yes stop_codon:yes gene_type:complete
MNQNDINNLRGKTAVVGLAESGCGIASGWSAMEIMANSVHDALDDAGIKLNEVDGVFAATAFHSMAAMSLSEYLGLKPKFADGSQIGGSSFLSHILTAALALDAGLINVAVVAYGSNQKSIGGFKTISEAMPYEAQYEPRMPVTAYALAAKRYMHEFGASREDLANVAVSARDWALLNPRAYTYEKGPLTIEDVLSARPIVDPLGKLDCCLVTDGGAAVVMTRSDRAKDTKNTPIYLLGAAMEHHHRMVSEMPDLVRTSAIDSSQRAFKMSSYKATDMDSIQLYDAFTINTLLFLEDLGFCKKGEAIELVKNNNIGPSGSLKVNTNGGGLSCVHPGMYGLFVTLEAIRQLRNSAGDNVGERSDGGWIDNAKLSVAHGNGGVLSSQVTNVWGVSETL